MPMFDQRKELEITRVLEPLGGIAGDRLRLRIRKLLQNGKRLHILDLRFLSALDSSTLAALIRVLRLVRASGGFVGLITDQADFLRLLSITALDRVFPVFHSNAAAEQALELETTIPA